MMYDMGVFPEPANLVPDLGSKKMAFEKNQYFQLLNQ